MTALILLGTASCGNGQGGPNAAVEGEPGTTLIVRSIEQTNEQGTVTSEALRSVDPETGTSTQLPAREFAGGDAQFDVIYATSSIVFRCSSGACVLHPGSEEPSRSLGEAWCMAPSQAAGRVWLASLDPESPETVRAIASVREVSLDGEVTVPASRLPRGRWQCPVGAVNGGVLFQEAHRLVVWDPTQREVVASLAGAVFPAATHDDLVAWCRLHCEGGLHVTNVATGEDEVVELEDPFVFEETYEGAFSPDGSALAVPASREDRRADSRIALVNVEHDRASVLPPTGGAASPIWSRNGDELFVIAGRATVAAYDLSSGEIRRIELDPPTTILTLVGG